MGSGEDPGDPDRWIDTSQTLLKFPKQLWRQDSYL